MFMSISIRLGGRWGPKPPVGLKVRVGAVDVAFHQRPCLVHQPASVLALTVELLTFAGGDDLVVLADLGDNTAGAIVAVEGVGDGVVDVGEVVHLFAPLLMSYLYPAVSAGSSGNSHIRGDFAIYLAI